MRREAMGCEAMGRDAMGRDAMAREAMGHEAMGCEAMGRDALGREAMGREVMGRVGPCVFYIPSKARAFTAKPAALTAALGAQKTHIHSWHYLADCTSLCTHMTRLWRLLPFCACLSPRTSAHCARR